MQSIYDQTCSGTCDISGPGSPAYDDAYFQINYVRAYTTGAPTSTSTAGPTSTATVITTSTLSGGDPATTGAADHTSGVTPVGGASATLAVLVCALLGLLLL